MVGGKEGFRKGTETEGQESEALQLIFPLWRPGWEEQHQAASVLLWDVLPVQTNRPRASGLMGTRPARGPNLLFFSFLFFALPPTPTPTPIPPSLNNQRSVDTHSSWRTHFNYSKQTWKNSPSLYQAFPHSNFTWHSKFVHQRWPSWSSRNQIPVTCTYHHRHTFSHFCILSLSLFPIPSLCVTCAHTELPMHLFAKTSVFLTECEYISAPKYMHN